MENNTEIQESMLGKTSDNYKDYYVYRDRVRKRNNEHVEKFLSIRSSRDLSRFTGCSLDLLQELILNPMYSEFLIPKKDKSFRAVQAPSESLKFVQKILNGVLQYHYYYRYKPANIHGFVVRPKGELKVCNIVSNAKTHVGKKYVLNIDLKDFFTSIRAKQIYQLFLSKCFKFNDNIAKSLTFLTTYNGFLPTGAPTSPVLSNFICLDLDYRLQRYCKLKQIQFSRYADDLTFSSDLEFTEVQRQKITDIIQSFNFEINPKKVYIKKQGSKQLVTGIVVNQKVNVERKMRKKVRAMLDNLTKNELETAAAKHFKHDKDSKKDTVPSFLNQLAGYINFIGQVRGKKDDLYLRYKAQFKHQLALKKVNL